MIPTETVFKYNLAGSEKQSSRWGFPAIDAGLGAGTDEMPTPMPVS